MLELLPALRICDPKNILGSVLRTYRDHEIPIPRYLKTSAADATYLNRNSANHLAAN
jgi:hypothetical protein